MIQIRDNVFETNSSSTHSLCISKDKFDYKNLPAYMNVYTDEVFGWGNDCLSTSDEKASYLYTAMVDCNMTAEMKDFEKKIENLGIKASFPKLEKHKGEDWYGIRGGVDHAGELIPFIHEVLVDEDKLCRFLFNPDSCVYTGNDGVDDSDDRCYVADAAENDGYVWGYDKDGNYTSKSHVHPMYNPEHFEYYFKGN